MGGGEHKVRSRGGGVGALDQHARAEGGLDVGDRALSVLGLDGDDVAEGALVRHHFAANHASVSLRIDCTTRKQVAFGRRQTYQRCE